MIKVSVIIPIYNVEKYIERCAKSLFEQSIDSIEYIFVDDCSPDDSVGILLKTLDNYSRKKQQVKLLKHKYNKGVAAARNTGIKAANGDFIIFCDSDDWIESDMYDIMYNTAINNKSDIVICDWNIVSNIQKKHIEIPPLKNRIECLIALFNGSLHGSLCNKLIKRQLYKDHKILCTEDINYLEDINIMYKLIYFSKQIDFIKKPLYNYFQDNTMSCTSSYINIQKQNGMLSVIKEIESFCLENNIHDIAINKSIINFILMIKGSILINGYPRVNTKYLNKYYTINQIFHQPSINIFYKLSVFLDYINLPLGVLFLRKLKIIFNRIKSKGNE